MIDLVFNLLIQATTTTVSVDWGVIAASVAPIITIVVTWYLQRRTTKDESAKAAAAAKQAAEELAQAHEADKQDAIKNRTQDTQTILQGQQDIADAVNKQLMILANARVKSLQERLVAVGGSPNDVPPTSLENAADVIDTLEKRLDKILTEKAADGK